MASTPTSSVLYRRFRPFRFTLRTLLLLLTVAAIALGLRVNTMRKQQAAIEELSQLHVHVYYDYQHQTLDPRQEVLSQWPNSPRRPAPQPPEPRWVHELLGDDLFHDVTAVRLPSDDPADIKAILRKLKELPALREVFIPSSAMCGLAIGPQMECRRLIEREFPDVKVTVFSIVPPIVG